MDFEDIPIERSPRRELQSSLPTPLGINKDSHKIKKPPLPPSAQRKPRQQIIIYHESQKVIHTAPDDFKDLVQRLTGLSSSSSSSSPSSSTSIIPSSSDIPSPHHPFNSGDGMISPAAPYAAVEKARPTMERKQVQPIGDDIRLTGSSSSLSSKTLIPSSFDKPLSNHPFNSGGAMISPAVRYATIEKPRSPMRQKQVQRIGNYISHERGLESVNHGVERGSMFQGILSPGQTSLSHIPSRFLSPQSLNPNMVNYVHELRSSGFQNRNFADQRRGFISTSPTNFVSQPSLDPNMVNYLNELGNPGFQNRNVTDQYGSFTLPRPTNFVPSHTPPIDLNRLFHYYPRNETQRR